MRAHTEIASGEFHHEMRWRCLVSQGLDVHRFEPVFASTRTYMARVELLHFDSRSASTPCGKWTLGRHGTSRSTAVHSCSAKRGCILELRVTYAGDAPILTGVQWETGLERAHLDLEAEEDSVGTFYLASAIHGEAPIGEDPADHASALPHDTIPHHPPHELAAAPLIRGLIEREKTANSVKAQPIPASAATAMSGDETIAARQLGLEFSVRAQRFFLELELATGPRTSSPDRRAAVQILRGRLDVRIAARAFYGATDRLPQFAALGGRDGALASALIGISALFKNLAERHLDYGDRHLLGWAFELFVTDQLAAIHPDPVAEDALTSHGAANGTEFFKFIELAFLCMEEGVDAAFWRIHLSDLVRSAELFLTHAQHPLGALCTARCPGSYAYVEGRFTPRQTIRAMRERYARELRDLSSVEQVHSLASTFTRVIAHAFSDRGTVAVGGVDTTDLWSPGHQHETPMQMA